MPDRFDAATRSRIMSRVRGKHTSPEIALRASLRAQGIRYRIHPPTIPGRPDVAHGPSKVAVFVDGCFWHGCPRHYRQPTSRVDFWSRKLAYVTDLRKRTLSKLEAMGWQAVEIWECDIRRSANDEAAKVVRIISQRLATTRAQPRARSPPRHRERAGLTTRTLPIRRSRS